MWSLGDFEAFGRSLAESPQFRFMAVVAGLLFTPREFYFWHNQPGKGPGNQMFTCVSPAIEDAGTNRVRVALRLQPGHEMFEEFFVTTKGSLAGFPRFLGLPHAQVEMSLHSDGATYDIVYPPGGGTLAWLRKAVTWPFTARSAAREVKEAHEILQQRYAELDEARIKLARQAMQLNTAYSIAQAVHQGLDVERTLKAVAVALVEQAGFAGAKVAIETDTEGRPLSRHAQHGDVGSGTEPIHAPVVVRARQIGEVQLWLTAGADRTERGELLEVVVPTIHMAIDDAVAFTSVVDYRDNLERKVIERTTELEHARDKLQATVLRLNEAQKVRDRIFANINHEIRTPLALVSVAVDALRERPATATDPEIGRRLHDIEASAAQLLGLVDDLLLLAAAEESDLRLHRVEADVAGILRRQASAWRPVAEANGSALSFVGPERLEAEVDPEGLGRMVTNLLSNAVKFTPKGGRIEVSLTEPDEAHVRVEVKDTGIGLDPTSKEHLFERFMPGRPAVHPGFRTSGVGLAIVKELAIAHGGRVFHADNPGGGSCFSFVLPRRGEATPGDVAGLRQTKLAAAFAPVPVPVSPVLGIVEPEVAADATVLCAEDDARLLEGIVGILGRTYRTIPAKDGVSALALAKEHRPDLLVTDIAMPNMDGIELAKRFRELPGNRLAPVIVLTAYGDVGTRLKSFEAGAVDYVAKPFVPAELVARVRAQLELRRLALKLHDAETMTSVGVLAAGLAHEIRNPANVVVNAIGPLRRLLPNGSVAAGTPAGEILAAVERNAAQMANLARELLGLRSGKQITLVETPVVEIIDHAIQGMIPRPPGVELVRRVEYDGKVLCAQPLVVQVLTNLLTNAVHAVGDAGEIAIHAFCREGVLVIDVADSGPGVPVELRDKIFDPFFTTKPPGVGTGLGLTMARAYVERHGGNLSLVTQSRGARFRVELPLEQPRTAGWVPTPSSPQSQRKRTEVS
ncbi:MAG: response regulator [Deltaproteobacteria bacterium]|nr:response regulator [Deltaproteobacteria bacterium]